MRAGLYKLLADTLNDLPEGRCIVISRQDIADLPGLPDWAFLAPITVGWPRVLENVIGSATDMWHIRENPLTGDMICCKRRWDQQRRRYTMEQP